MTPENITVDEWIRRASALENRLASALALLVVAHHAKVDDETRMVALGAALGVDRAALDAALEALVAVGLAEFRNVH